MNYYENVLDLIGNTPLVKLNRMVEDGMATILAKMEQLNPLNASEQKRRRWIGSSVSWKSEPLAEPR